jgi:hypothetical protein
LAEIYLLAPDANIQEQIAKIGNLDASPGCHRISPLERVRPNVQWFLEDTEPDQIMVKHIRQSDIGNPTCGAKAPPPLRDQFVA